MNVASKSKLLRGLIDHPYDCNPEYLAKINFFHVSEDNKLIAAYWEAPKGWITFDYQGFAETITVLEGEMLLTCDGTSYTAKAGDCCVMKDGDSVKFEIIRDIKAIVVIYPANEDIKQAIDQLIANRKK